MSIKMRNINLIETKKINMFHFDLLEGKFEDLTQAECGHPQTFFYASISNHETDNYAGSTVRIYAHSFDEMYCAEEYELYGLESDESLCRQLKDILLKQLD